MSDQPSTPAPNPAPDTPLDPVHDKDTLELLNQLEMGPASAISNTLQAFRVHLGNRIGGDLRPRVLKGETTIRNLQASVQQQRGALEQATAKLADRDRLIAELQAQLEVPGSEKQIEALTRTISEQKQTISGLLADQKTADTLQGQLKDKMKAKGISV